MTYPYLVPERHSLPILGLVAGLLPLSLDVDLHPVFLYHKQGKEQILYIENDKERITITIERTLKPGRKPSVPAKPKKPAVVKPKNDNQ